MLSMTEAAAQLRTRKGSEEKLFGNKDQWPKKIRKDNKLLTFLKSPDLFHKAMTSRSYDPNKVIGALLHKLPDNPFSLKLRLLWENEEWSQITSWEFDPTHFNNPRDAFDCLVASSLLKKYKGFKRLLPDVNTRQVALEKWESAEDQCRLTNETFRLRASGEFCFSPDVEAIFHGAQRKIARILGCVSLDDIWDLGNFGPGIDLGTSGVSPPVKKLRDPGQATPALLRALRTTEVYEWPVFEMMKIGSGILPIQGIPWNRVTFVPKNCKTDRSIAVEGRWNIFFQKGAGSLIRSALKRFGCDLDSQTKNQCLARDLGYCTVDLSSASDTLAWALVYDLLPVEWSDALDRLRSPMSRMPNKSTRLLEKFSSMGNGFTFELESLIFFAISWQVSETLGFGGDLSVFGDDIIVRAPCYDLLVRCLNAAGFLVNDEKSFASGYYRESCGEHFFDTHRITPMYLKEVPNNVERIVSLANQVNELAGSTSNSAFRDVRFLDCRRRLVRFIPKNLRFFGPSGLAGVLHGSLDEHCLPRHPSWEACQGWVPLFVPLKYAANDLSFLYEKLVKASSNGNYFVGRRRGRWRLRWVTVADSQEPGPWLSGLELPAAIGR